MLAIPSLKADVSAGIVVALVALPLCLGIALASGVPLLAGLVSGIVGGLVVAWLSGSRVSVSGPAAGLVVIVIDAIATLGSFEAFLVATLLAGVLQCLLGMLRAGRLAACVPSPVIKGMLAAIGITLIIKQLPLALGYASSTHALQHLPDDLGQHSAWLDALSTVTWDATIVALVSLALLFAWEKPWLKRLPLIGQLPAPLVVVAFGVAYHAVAAALDPATALADFQRVRLPQVNGIEHLLQQLAVPDWSVLKRWDVYVVAATLAVVASLETLLCLEAADKLDPQKQASPPNRELLAQGTGNIVAGLFGGLPITAVIVRTSANINAGARTRLSAMIHGVLLLASVLALAQWMSWLPLAALAAILLHTGAKLAKPALFVHAWRQGPAASVPFMVTLVAILCTDLLVGIVIGLGCSLLFLVHAQTRGALTLTSHGGAHLLRLNKDVPFFSKSLLRQYLAQINPGDSLVIDGSRCSYLDRDIREMLEDFAGEASERNIDIEWRHVPSPTTGMPVLGWQRSSQRS